MAHGALGSSQVALEYLEREASERGDVVRQLGWVNHADGAPGYLAVDVRPSSPGLPARLAITTDGRVRARGSVHRSFMQRHIDKWGKMGLDSARTLVAASREQPIDAMVWYDRTRVPAEQMRRELLRLGLTAEVEPAPHPPVAFVRLQPEEPDRLLAASRLDSVNRVHVVQGLQPVNQGVPAGYQRPNNAVHANTVNHHNAEGIFGKGVKIGLTETPGGILDPVNGFGCRLMDEHQAFAHNGFTYSNPNQIPCTDDSQCAGCDQQISSGVLFGKCVSGRCVAQHASRVASRISSNSECDGQVKDTMGNNIGSAECAALYEGKYMAAESDLFVPNNFPVNFSTLSPRIAEAYHWLDQRGVRIVNESWQQDGPFGTITDQVILADWYARYKHMNFVISARNVALGGNGDTGCYGLNTICVGGMMADRFVTADGQQRLWSNSAWLNPTPIGKEFYEVSKPDVIAHGGTQPGASQSTPTIIDVRNDSHEKWMLGEGNSYAAPVAAGLLALHEEDCGGTPFSPALNRVHLRSSTGIYNYRFTETNYLSAVPNAWANADTCDGSGHVSAGDVLRYPTADVQFGCDHKTGSGAINARLMRIWCRPPSGGGGGGGSPGPGGGLAQPDDPSWWTSSGESGTATPGVGTPIGQGTWGSALDEADPATYVTGGLALSPPNRVRDDPSALYEVLWSNSVGNLARMRGTFAYYGCPTGPITLLSSGGDNDVAVNLDVAVCGRAGANPPECLWVSEAGNETNEGFDVNIPAAFTEVALLLIKPANWAPCSDLDGQTSVAEEYRWNFMYWVR